MTIYVFLGPTLDLETAREILHDAVYLPPAAQGDLLWAARERPWGIGLIDGYFERVPSVWHKEILWALEQGVRVVGSSSMGALRAAELALFGMEGVGEVFASYRDGALEDDDEVALIHGTAEEGYRPLSEAMVNIRCTLAAASRAEVIGEDTHQALVDLAKDLFYPERSYPRLLDIASEDPRLSQKEIDRFSAWLPEGRVDQKREDALVLLRWLRDRRREDQAPRRADFTFRATDAWMELHRQVRNRPPLGAPGSRDQDPASWVDELRLLGTDTYGRIREQAWARLFGLDIARGRGVDRDDAFLIETISDFCGTRHLHTMEALDAWLESRGMDRAGFHRWMEDEMRLRRLRRLHHTRWQRELIESDGWLEERPRLEERARKKNRVVPAAAVASRLEAHGLTEDGLWRWYFETRLEQPVPDDLEAYARELDLPDSTALRRLVQREFVYWLDATSSSR